MFIIENIIVFFLVRIRIFYLDIYINKKFLQLHGWILLLRIRMNTRTIRM